MKISLGANLQALQAARRLSNTSSELGSTFQKLSSGLRIQSAADDPSGLAVLSKLKVDTRVASVAIRNAGDGISQVSLAVDGITQIISILSRMRELAQQSANSTYTNAQRSALSTEFTLLAEESDRTAATIAFNKVVLLSNPQDTYIQVGLRGDGTDNSILIPRTSATLQSVGVKDAFDQLTVSIIGNTTDVSQSVSRNSLPVLEAAIETLTQRRSVLAASENRLHSAVNYLSVSRENLAAASGRIGDADQAAEAATLVRLQILQNAQQAVLAQANQSTALVLKLLS